MNNKRTPSDKGAHQNRQENNSTIRSLKLTKEECIAIKKRIPESSMQFRRMTDYLANHPDTLTTKLCIACASVNLSDVARKHNHLIRPAGFYVDCYRPPYPVYNRFGGISNQFLWGLYRIGGDK